MVLPFVHQPFQSSTFCLMNAMMSSLVFIASFVALASGLAFPNTGWHTHGYPGHPTSTWNLKKFTSLVIFGDSYSDDSRLSYFINTTGVPPPVGWVNPVVCRSELHRFELPPIGPTDNGFRRTTTQQTAAASGANTSNNTPDAISTTTPSPAPSAATTSRLAGSV